MMVHVPEFEDEYRQGPTTIFELIRSGAAVTRADLVRRSGLGRTAVERRLAELLRSRLIVDGEPVSTGLGRLTRRLRLHAERAVVLACTIDLNMLWVGLADLAGQLINAHEEPTEIRGGPADVLNRVEGLAADLLEQHDRSVDDVWSAGVGLPGPVDFATGRSLAWSFIPGWDSYDLRGRLAGTLAAPVWIDNRANLLALAELRHGLGRGRDNFFHVNVGAHIGAGVVVDGALHRGAHGSAGEIGHTTVTDEPGFPCQCGKNGCLDAVASGQALVTQAQRAVAAGRSVALAELLAERGRLDLLDVLGCARRNDSYCVRLLIQAGQHVGRAIAGAINFHNPELVIISGVVAEAGDAFLAAVKQETYRLSLPLATARLDVARSGLGQRGGLLGAAAMAVDQIFAPEQLRRWIAAGSPRRRPKLAGSG